MFTMGFFICYLAAPHMTLATGTKGQLPSKMVTTVFLLFEFQPKMTHSDIGSLNPAKCPGD